jgi:HlyD family secretion protein
MESTKPEASVAKATTARKKTDVGLIVKRILEVLVALAVVGGIVYAAIPKPVPVETASVAKGALVVTVDEDGKTRLKDRFVVSAPLAGNLARIELRAGDRVEQGQVLARIVPLRSPLLDARSKTEAEARVSAAQAASQQADAQIERARTALDFAIKESQRSQELLQRNSLSAQQAERSLLEQRAREADLTSATFGAKVAAHELRMARAALGQLTDKDTGEQLEVPSPIGGRVVRVIQESEGVVQPGTQLLELGDATALEIVVDVLTKDAVAIRPGSPVSIEEWGGEPLPARVRLVEPSAFTRTSALGVEEQRVNVIVDLAAPHEQWQALGDGYRVEARIEVFRADDAVKVPSSALFRRDGGWAVFVVEGEVARQRTLKTGLRNDREVEVLEGLGAGEVVILHPSDRVQDGVEIVRR